ncbi:MAG: hypothetical protein LC725_01580, partial [Lentisphaerae bacterium]|nr:hypothetical protein [Lentisphaerota bacterium]
SRGWIESLAWYYLAEPAAAVALPPAAERAPPPDAAGPEGVMLHLLNYERFGDYTGALEFIDGILMKQPEQPFADVLRVRRTVYAARMEPDRLPGLLHETLRAVTDEEARRQARQLLNFAEQPQVALLGLNANMPARVFLNGEVVLQAGTPDQFVVMELKLPPGRHVLALQCQPRPYPDWVQLHLRTHGGDVYTAPDWRHAVNPPGAWWLPGYNDADWAQVGGSGCKGPPEEPYLVLRPNAFVDTQSRAVALRPTVDWTSRTGAVVYRRVFEVPED